MGCSNSKDAGTVSQNPTEFKPKEIVDSRPDALRRDITATYKNYTTRRDKIKPLLAEKYGVTAIIDDEREKLVAIMLKKDRLAQERAPFMARVWERDADDIYQAFQKFSADKSTIVNILCARTYWQINEIARVFESKYNTPLLEKVVSTMIGVLTGSGTGLSKLLTYRILPQPERDAALLRDATDGISLDDAGLLEVLCTRSNLELSRAMDVYERNYKKNLIDIVRSKSSYKNYREFVLKILECNRDEDDLPFEYSTAKALANELYAAGAARTVGMDPEPFIRILATVNHKQFESINNQYPGKNLVKDITAKFGGDFQLALLTKIADKYEYLANRIELSLKGFSPDKEALSRILGCLSRPECIKVKLAYNRMGFKRTLDEAIRGILKSEHSFLNGCLLLISEDAAITPLGSDREEYEEDIENSREADRLATAEYSMYQQVCLSVCLSLSLCLSLSHSHTQIDRWFVCLILIVVVVYRVQDKVIEKGEQIMTAKRRAGKRFRLLSSSPDDPTNPAAAAASSSEVMVEMDETNAAVVHSSEDSVNDATTVDPVVAEEDRVLGFQWDGKGRFLDAAKLTTVFRELEYADNQAQIMLDKLGDEVDALKGVYKTILKSRFETECFNRSYASHIRAVKQFVENRDKFLSAANLSMKKK
jgi:uncharacterized protein YukE